MSIDRLLTLQAANDAAGAEMLIEVQRYNPNRGGVMATAISKYLAEIGRKGGQASRRTPAAIRGNP